VGLPGQTGAMHKLLFLAFALAAPATALPAQPQPSAAPAASVDEALVARFIAALPHAQQSLDSTDETNGELLQRFSVLNPGREAEVRTLVEGYSRCAGPALREATVRLFADVARQLGADKVNALIRFYTGPDFKAFAALAPDVQAGRLTPAAMAEFQRLLAAYPLTEFHATLQRVGSGLDRDQVFASAITGCARALRTGLESRRLRVN
jgi:hypothetical protein